MSHRARAFGHDWVSDIALDQFDAGTETHSGVEIAVSRVEALAERAILGPVGRGAVFADGFRVCWADEVVFDLRNGSRIEYLSGPGWHGSMPAAFYGTVAALTLADRGLLPLHASAIELGGYAWLLAGPAGAGKSTLAAALVGAGARLIGDDLSVLDPAADFAVPRGRPAMRLHPETAALIAHGGIQEVPEDPRGKVLVRPTARAADAALPLGGIVLLGEGPSEVSPAEAVQLLPTLLFRPYWLRASLGHLRRRAQLLKLASQTRIQRLSPIAAFDELSRARKIDRVLALVAR